MSKLPETIHEFYFCVVVGGIVEKYVLMRRY